MKKIFPAIILLLVFVSCSKDENPDFIANMKVNSTNVVTGKWKDIINSLTPPNIYTFEKNGRFTVTNNDVAVRNGTFKVIYKHQQWLISLSDESETYRVFFWNGKLFFLSLMEDAPAGYVFSPL